MTKAAWVAGDGVALAQGTAATLLGLLVTNANAAARTIEFSSGGGAGTVLLKISVEGATTVSLNMPTIDFPDGIFVESSDEGPGVTVFYQAHPLI